MNAEFYKEFKEMLRQEMNQNDRWEWNGAGVWFAGSVLQLNNTIILIETSYIGQWIVLQ